MGARSNGYRREDRDGTIHWIIDFRFIDSDGVRQRFRRDAQAQSAAGAAAEAVRRRRFAAETGSPFEKEPASTFAAFVSGSFEPLIMPRFKPSTREGYKQLLHGAHGLLAMLGKKRLDTIGAADARVVEARALSRNVKARYSLLCLRSVLRSAVELGALSLMPQLPKLPARSKKLPAAPPMEVVERVLGACAGWHRVAIVLATLGGLRMGEIRALEVRDIDLDRDCLFVRRAFSAGEIVTPKGGDEETVPLAPLLRQVLAEAIEGKRPLDRVLFKKGGTPSEGGVDGALRRIQKQLGIEPAWSLHKLRHFFATTLLRGGATLESVRKLLRHKDLASTARYVHTTDRDTLEAMKALDGVGNCGETSTVVCH
jgi:integrase